MKGQLLYELLNFIFPAECLHCGKDLSSGNNQFICDDCLNSIRRTPRELLKEEKKRKFDSTGFVKDFFSPFIFEKEGALQSLIHQLKYNNKFGIGNYLGELIAQSGERIIRSWRCDFIIPIPLHPIKKAERGYNQSKQIAKGISQKLNIKVKSNTLKRIKFTESQTKMNLHERRENVKNVFSVKYFNPRNKNLILVDDVITTGSTINSAAEALKNKGANNIYALSIALAKPSDFI